MINQIQNRLGEQCISFVHPSGLPVFLIPKDFSVSYAILGVRYGSLDNHFRSGNKTVHPPMGIAHFLEHKLFENPDGEDTFVKFSRTGADANAYTTFTRTAYLFSATEKFEESLSVLLESCMTPYFTKENVEKEQGIIAEEIRMYEDDPFDMLYFSLMRAMYKKTDLGVSICGTEDSISQITPELLYDCYNSFYHPKNMALCLCGNITKEQIIPVLNKVLGCVPQQVPEVSPLVEKENEDVLTRDLKLHGDVVLPLFAAGFKYSNISDDPAVRLTKYATMAILFEALFGGSTDFAYKLYSESIITGALDFEFDHNKRYSYLILQGECPEPDKVKAELCSYLASIRQNGIDKERLDGARKIVYSQFLSTFDRTESISNEILTYVFEEQDMLSYGELVLSITNEACLQLFEEFFHDNHFTFAALYPDNESEENT